MENFFEIDEIIETEEELDYECDDSEEECEAEEYDGESFDDDADGDDGCFGWLFARGSYHYDEYDDEYYDDDGELADYVEGATAAWWDDAMEK